MSWDTNIKNLSVDDSVDAISDTVEAVFKHLYESGAASLTFRDFTVDNVNVAHLAAALRVCSSMKNEVVGWNYGLRVAYDASLQQGLDPQDVLYGMLEPQ